MKKKRNNVIKLGGGTDKQPPKPPPKKETANLTVEIQEKICARIRAGESFDFACRNESISFGLARRWLRRGNQYKSGLYHEFVKAVQSATEGSVFGSNRQCLLSPELMLKFCTALRQGNFIGTAAALCGIDRSTVYSYLQKAEQENAQEIYKVFKTEVEKASADAEAFALGQIMLAATEREVVKTKAVRTVSPDGTEVVVGTKEIQKVFDPRAAEWFLERRYPKKWGYLQKLAGPDGEALEFGGPKVGVLIVQQPYSAEQWDEIVAETIEQPKQITEKEEEIKKNA